MEPAAGEGAQQALEEMGTDALVEKASMKQVGSGSEQASASAEEKEVTAGSEEEEPVHKEKKARKGDDEKAPASAEEKKAGKGDEEKPAAEEEAWKGDDKALLIASAQEVEAGKEGVEDKALLIASAKEEAAGKEGVEDKALLASAEEEAARKEDVEDKEALLASAEEKVAGKEDVEGMALLASAVEEVAGKEDDDDKAMLASAEEEAAGKEDDEDKALLASAEEEEAMMERDDDKPPTSAEKEEEAWEEGDGDKPPASSAGKEKAREAGDDENTAPASAEEEEEAQGDEDDAPELDDQLAADPVQADAVAQANPADAVALANLADAEAPHLPLDIIVFDIFSRLPSKSAARCALVAKPCEQRLRQNLFFNAHLAPGCRCFVRDEPPNLLVLKPTGRGTLAGYSHLTVMSTASKVIYDMPIRTDMEEEDYHLFRKPNQPKPMVIDFFHTTVTELDLSIMAGEGRVLLGYSGKHGGFFVCNPSEQRVIKLPNLLLDIDIRRTAAAIKYVLGSFGEMREFSVLLLSALPGPHSYGVYCFSSAKDVPGSVWVLREWEGEEVRAVIEGVSAPGVYGRETGTFSWINSQTGMIIEYDPKEHRISLVLPPPPEAEAHPIRKQWCLGSTAGQLRLSCFSVGRDAEDEPYLQIDVGGLLSVWIKNDAVWRSVKHVSVPVVWVLSFYRRMEVPVDAASADSHSILVKKDDDLMLRALEFEDADMQVVCNLYMNVDPYLHRMYRTLSAFYIYL